MPTGYTADLPATFSEFALLWLAFFAASFGWGAILGYLNNRYDWRMPTLFFMVLVAALSEILAVILFLRHFTKALV